MSLSHEKRQQAQKLAQLMLRISCLSDAQLARIYLVGQKPQGRAIIAEALNRARIQIGPGIIDALLNRAAGGFCRQQIWVTLQVKKGPVWVTAKDPLLTTGGQLNTKKEKLANEAGLNLGQIASQPRQYRWEIRIETN